MFIIKCISSKIGLLFSSVERLYIANLEIRDCGSDISQSTILSRLKLGGDIRSTTSILADSIGEFNLTSMIITNSTGFGLLVIGYSSDSKTTIQKSTLQYGNNNLKELHTSNSTSVVERPGGNIFIILMKGDTFPFAKHLVLIIDSIIKSGCGSSYSGVWRKGIQDKRFTSGGLTIWIFSGNYVHIQLENSTFRHNTAPTGGGLYINGISTQLLIIILKRT